MALLPMTDAVKAAFGRALNSESESTRNAAAIAVSKAGLGNNERVIGLLISALADDDLRYEAENALSNGGVPLLRPVADAVIDESRSIESRRAAARFLADYGNSAIWIIPQLEQATEADDADLAILSAAAMARLRSDKAPVDLLLSALDKGVEEETLERAINALSNNAALNKSPAAIDRLIETLNHDDESIASYARYALDDQKLTDAQVAKVAELLTDEEAVEKGYPAQEAAMLVGKAGESGAVHLPRVVELFRNASSNDVYAYENAFTSFGTLAVPSLLELIGDPGLGKEHRSRAVSALDSIAYEYPIEAKSVAGLLTHEDLAVRVAAAAALVAAKAEASTVLPVLLEGIQSGDRNIGNMAFNALAKLEPQPAAVPVYRKLLADEDFEQYYHVHHLLTQLGPDIEPLIPDLIATLAKPDPDDDYQYDRQNVENVLSQIDSSLVPKLVEALQHESHQVRYHVLGALRIHDPEATKDAADAIAALIDDPNSDVAMQAAITLMRIAPREEAVPKVVEALELTEEDSIYFYDLRDNAMSALQEASSKAGELVRPLVPKLAAMLAAESDKYGLLYTLGALKENGKEALPALITTLQNDRQMRWQTLNAIDQIGPTPEALDAVLEIVREGDGQNMERAVAILDKHGEAASQALDLLMPKLREPYQRYHAVVALGELESQADRVTPLLEKALQSGDDELIVAAIKAAWSLQEAAKPLTPALLTLFRSEDHRIDAIRAIGMLGESGAGAVSSLRAGLKHADRDVRVASASALSSIGSASAPAVPELIAMLDDVEDGAGAAARALGSIGDPAKGAIPRMIELLDDERVQYSVIDSLAEFGPAASAALPKLRELEAAKSGWRKDSITQAIAEIEGTAEPEEE